MKSPASKRAQDPISLPDAMQSAQSAQKALDAVNAAGQDLSESLQQSIERMRQQAQADMADLQRHLEMDGVESRSASNGGSAQDLDAAFSLARQEALATVLGQEEYIDSLTLAFKRPFVAGSSDSAPLCRAVVAGRKGSGRHSGINALCSSLGRQGVLKSPKTLSLDLSVYGAPGSEKLFIQDLYSALKSPASALVFENYGKCHASVLPMVSAVFSTGQVPLPGRYAEQKGLLVDVGTALAPGAVSSLSAGGKYLFLLSEDGLPKLSGAFGSIFISGLDDVLYTKDFTPDALVKISSQKLKDLCERAEKQLGFSLVFEEAQAELLSKSYSLELGVSAITQRTGQIYKAMSEEKLRKSLRSGQSAKSIIEDGALCVSYQGENTGGVIKPVGENSSYSQAEIEAVRHELQNIVGLGNVKDYILSLEDNFKMQRLRRERGLKAEVPSMHMIFTGNPGTGKTTVARIAARFLKAIGALSGGQLVEVTRADLVGQYVGHTAPLTQRAIQSAIGGVLFIDEAYSLYRGRDDSFGLEAIDTLVKGMEDHRDKLVVILAGYSKEMEEFLTANSGLRSRFPNIIEFPDYSPQELLEITESIVLGMGYRLSEDCGPHLIGYYQAMQITGSRSGGNGRMARNKVEAAVIACSRRNIQAQKNGDPVENLDLLLPEDFGFAKETLE